MYSKEYDKDVYKSEEESFVNKDSYIYDQDEELFERDDDGEMEED